MRTLQLQKRIASEELHKELMSNPQNKEVSHHKSSDHPILVATSESDAMMMFHFIGAWLNPATPCAFNQKAVSSMKVLAAIHNVSVDILDGGDISLKEFSDAHDRARQRGMFYISDRTEVN